MMRYLLFPFFILALLTTSASAWEVVESRTFASKNENVADMLVDILREDSPECEGGTREAIQVYGGIIQNASRYIADMVKSLPRCPDRIVYLSEGGGYAQGAIDMGNLFKRYNVHTVVPAGQICGGVCPIAFIGGRKRSMEDGGSIKFSVPCLSKTGIGEVRKCKPRTVKILRNYAREMLGHNSLSKTIADGLVIDTEWNFTREQFEELGLLTD